MLIICDKTIGFWVFLDFQFGEVQQNKCSITYVVIF